MDLNLAIRFAQLVNAVYAVQPNDLTNRAGTSVAVGPQGNATPYEILTTIYANDLATDISPLRAQDTISVGLILQATTGDVVIAIRGTEGILEWVQDAKFLSVPCPFLRSGGDTEDGFTAMYDSITVDPATRPTSLARTLATLPLKRPVASLTVCGHSLGGALATLLALDLAANASSPFNTPVVYTYASPKVGSPGFVSTYNHAVPNTVRVANRMDLVPKLPLPPLYDHVSIPSELNPVKLGIPPKILVKCDIPCEHYLTSYLHLLSQLSGGAVLPLDAACIPA